MGDRRGPARPSGHDLFRRGVHATEADEEPRQARLHDVVHVLHVEEQQLGAARISRRADELSDGGVLPRQPVCEYAGHSQRVSGARWTGGVSHSLIARVDSASAVRPLQRLRAVRERADASGERGVSRFGEVPDQAA